MHADIGGYKEGEQFKSQDMAFYAMQTMINKAEEYGINFKPIPQNQQPSVEFTQLMNYYKQAQNNLQNNPSLES